MLELYSSFRCDKQTCLQYRASMWVGTMGQQLKWLHKLSQEQPAHALSQPYHFYLSIKVSARASKRSIFLLLTCIKSTTSSLVSEKRLSHGSNSSNRAVFWLTSYVQSLLHNCLWAFSLSLVTPEGRPVCHPPKDLHQDNSNYTITPGPRHRCQCR